jgi:hypothetical protein
MEYPGQCSTGISRLAVYVDLGGQEHWHRREWEQLFSSGGGPGIRIVAEEKDADCVLSAGSPWHFGKGGSRWGYSAPKGPLPRFVWDSGDNPTGHEPGLYCSLPRPLFDDRRHRTFCYPISYNECVAPFDLSEASILFGFMGGITSGVRSRMIESLKIHGRPDEMSLTVQSGPWKAMFDRSGLAIKQSYADTLRKCRFFLCPRGNGVGSVRLFETMKAARVPVIVSDNYVPPTEINWDDCSVRVAERDLGDLPAVLRERAADWARLATNARRNWEDCFSDGRLLVGVGQHLRELMDRTVPLSLGARARILSYPVYSRIRSGLSRLRSPLP